MTRVTPWNVSEFGTWFRNVGIPLPTLYSPKASESFVVVLISQKPFHLELSGEKTNSITGENKLFRWTFCRDLCQIVSTPLINFPKKQNFSSARHADISIISSGNNKKNNHRRQFNFSIQRNLSSRNGLISYAHCEKWEAIEEWKRMGLDWISSDITSFLQQAFVSLILSIALHYVGKLFTAGS